VGRGEEGDAWLERGHLRHAAHGRLVGAQRLMVRAAIVLLVVAMGLVVSVALRGRW
jgi:hypothetical protein